MSINWNDYLNWVSQTAPNATADDKRQTLKMLVAEVLLKSDWTDLPNSGLSLTQQLDQQAIRAEWMALDDPDIDPDTVVLPQYPLMERP